jgi:hypothetical protein
MQNPAQSGSAFLSGDKSAALKTRQFRVFVHKPEIAKEQVKTLPKRLSGHMRVLEAKLTG